MRWARILLTATLFGALTAAIGWTLGEFLPMGAVRCEPFSDCANDTGMRYALYSAIAGLVLGVLVGSRK